jgi:RimJ/RimL family protein N-acetyltransferase
VARAMLEKVLAQCKTIDGLEEVNLAVGTFNQPARALYKSLGFETYGIEPRAIKIENTYVDEELMVLQL